MTDNIFCGTCNNNAVLPAEHITFEGETCPQCGSSWTGDEKQSTIVEVTMPDSITGGVG